MILFGCNLESFLNWTGEILPITSLCPQNPKVDASFSSIWTSFCREDQVLPPSVDLL